MHHNEIMAAFFHSSLGHRINITVPFARLCDVCVAMAIIGSVKPPSATFIILFSFPSVNFSILLDFYFWFRLIRWFLPLSRHCDRLAIARNARALSECIGHHVSSASLLLVFIFFFIAYANLFINPNALCSQLKCMSQPNSGPDFGSDTERWKWWFLWLVVWKREKNHTPGMPCKRIENFILGNIAYSLRSH